PGGKHQRVRRLHRFLYVARWERHQHPRAARAPLLLIALGMLDADVAERGGNAVPSWNRVLPTLAPGCFSVAASISPRAASPAPRVPPRVAAFRPTEAPGTPGRPPWAISTTPKRRSMKR